MGTHVVVCVWILFVSVESQQTREETKKLRQKQQQQHYDTQVHFSMCILFYRPKALLLIVAPVIPSACVCDSSLITRSTVFVLLCSLFFLSSLLRSVLFLFFFSFLQFILVSFSFPSLLIHTIEIFYSYFCWRTAQWYGVVCWMCLLSFYVMTDEPIVRVQALSLLCAVHIDDVISTRK